MTKKDDTADAPKAEAPKTMDALLRKGFVMKDGMKLQADREVKYQVQGGKKIVVGPNGLRPAILMGHQIP